MTNAAAPGSSAHEQTENIESSFSNGNHVNAESNGVGDVNPRNQYNVDILRSWEYCSISDSAQLSVLKLPDPKIPSKVVRLMYIDHGLGLLALTSNACHKLWKWKQNEQNVSAESSTALCFPQFWQPDNGFHMTNDLSGLRPTTEEPASCFAITKNQSYLISASGGKFSLFLMPNFQVIAKFLPAPPAATYVALNPYDNNIFAIGMEDSSILICRVRFDEVQWILRGHKDRITGLAFSRTLDVLVSSGADTQLCVWTMSAWDMIRTKFIEVPPEHTSPLVGDTTVQFNISEDHLLVVHESQISIYDDQLECLRSWYPREALFCPIMCGTYSCDGLLVYVGFSNGAVGIFDSDTLWIRCHIAPSAYIPSSISRSRSRDYPVVIAAHTLDPTQFALGMSDGTVYVIEPLTAGELCDSDNESCLLNG